jgi:hypothetical protein
MNRSLVGLSMAKDVNGSEHLAFLAMEQENWKG